MSRGDAEPGPAGSGNAARGQTPAGALRVELAEDDATAIAVAELVRALPQVADLCELLARVAPELEAWVVGGVVRDLVLGRADEIVDVDISVLGDGTRLGHRLAAASSVDVKEHPSFGTASLVLELAGAPVRVDLATARTERYSRPGALPKVRPAASIEQDLARRDLTINAIAVPLGVGEDVVGVGAVDPWNGIGDCAGRVARVLHPASFVDDPTRLLRMARYAGALALEVDPSTRMLALGSVADGACATVSPRRWMTELNLLLDRPAALAALAVARPLGIIDAVLVQLPAQALANVVDRIATVDAASPRP